jgi:hypothetical protein
LTVCTSSDECPPGWACANTCCGIFGFPAVVCVPPCGDPPAGDAPTDGPTTAG